MIWLPPTMPMPSDDMALGGVPLVEPRRAAAVACEPLHVCHVISGDLWAGAEVQVATTAAFLARRRDIVLSAVVFNEGTLACELRKLGVAVTVADETRMSALGIARRLIRHLHEHEVDLVHTHRYNDTVLGAVAAAAAGTARLVRTVHGHREPPAGWRRIKFDAYERLERLALRWRGDLLIAVSGEIEGELRRRGFRAERVLRIPNGIDATAVEVRQSRAVVRQELGLGPETFVIGTVGRLNAVKNQQALLRAARIVRQRHANTAVLIVGDGPLAGTLRDDAAALGIADACVFTGSRRDVHDLMAAMDVFVLPSLSEGTPMALLEAMALGVPVVATAVGGVPDVVDRGITGLLVSPGSDDALAAACLIVARDPWRARWMTARARRAVRERFSSERTGRSLVQAYRRLTAAPPAPAAGRTAAVCAGAALELVERAAARLRRDLARAALGWRRQRHPTAPGTWRHTPRRILVVCHGNVIRSAFAARMLAARLADVPGFQVQSAGLQATPGQPCHVNAVAAAAARHIDLGGHAAARLAPEHVRASDLILVMDVPQLLAVRDRFPEARTRTLLLTAFAPDVPLEVEDPVFGDASAFVRCFDHITGAIEPLARLLAQRGRP